MREKSASSVTVVSSDSSVSWSNPPPLLYNSLVSHLSSSTSSPSPPSRLKTRSVHETRTPSNVMPQNYQPHPDSVSNILNGACYLSSSVPSETTLFSYEKINPILSAPSSPTTRSRSQSISAQSDDSSLKHMLTNLMNGETGYVDQADDVKLVRRWVKLEGHVYLANIILVLSNAELCSVIVCRDDPDKVMKKRFMCYYN